MAENANSASLAVQLNALARDAIVERRTIANRKAACAGEHVQQAQFEFRANCERRREIIPDGADSGKPVAPAPGKARGEGRDELDVGCIMVQEPRQVLR